MTESKNAGEDETLPEQQPEGSDTRGPIRGIWMRGLWTLILFVLFGVAETLVVVAAILQFGWMLWAREKNAFIAEFGESLGNWLAKTARFQTGKSDEKPFPWTRWS